MARRTKNFSQPDLEALAVRLRDLVGDGESMNAFCRRVGNVSSGNMSLYVNAKKMPTLETLISIANAAGVTLDWLATGLEPKFRRDIRTPVSINASGKQSIAAGGNVTIFHPTKKEG
jgi:transcriptional regulator with XRE-family HTH domain